MNLQQRPRLVGTVMSIMSLTLTAWGERYGAAALPHTAACLTVALPMAVFGWLTRSALPASAALVLVAFIQWSA